MTKRSTLLWLGCLAIVCFAAAGGCKHTVVVPASQPTNSTHLTGSATIGWGNWSLTFSYKQLTNGCWISLPGATAEISNRLVSVGATWETNIFKLATVDTQQRREAVNAALLAGATLVRKTPTEF